MWCTDGVEVEEVLGLASQDVDDFVGAIKPVRDAARDGVGFGPDDLVADDPARVFDPLSQLSVFIDVYPLIARKDTLVSLTDTAICNAKPKNKPYEMTAGRVEPDPNIGLSLRVIKPLGE